jgi:hypothetical protein
MRVADEPKLGALSGETGAALELLDDDLEAVELTGPRGDSRGGLAAAPVYGDGSRTPKSRSPRSSCAIARFAWRRTPSRIRDAGAPASASPRT